MAKLIFIAVMFFLLAGLVTGRRQNPLLIEEGGKGRSRSSECQFGKQLRELGSTWFADLGPPFGVMYCIRCQCVPFQRKRRVVARVQCRNIKNECPKPMCEEPSLLPGRCCKTCPEFNGYSPDVVHEIAHDVAPLMTSEEEERNMKHFGAILTGRTSLVLHRDDAVMASSPIHNHESYVATGRFTFHKKHLYYSFYTSANTRPNSIQFVDHQGNILEEQALLGDTPYQNSTEKVCGVWRRVARDYRKLLREEKVYASLLWGAEKISLSGPVARYRALSTELFSSLLQVGLNSNRNAMRGAGGTAIVTASTSTPSIHMELVFNGVFTPKEVYDVPLVVRLEMADKQTVILEEIVKIVKPGYEINVAELKSAVTQSDLRHLTRGKLKLIIENKNNPELRLEGRLQTRTTCEVFQSLVSSSDTDQGSDPSSDPSSEPGEDLALQSLSTTASGVGLFYINKDGALVYNVQMDHLNQEPTPLIAIVSGRGRRKVELEDLTPQLVNNKALGHFDRLSPKELEQLYGGELTLNVATEKTSSLIRGRLAGRPVADARDSFAPALLRRIDVTKPAKLTGLIWVAVDMECTLHYEVLLSGLSDEKVLLELFLEEIPFEATNAPVSRRLLEEFSNMQLEGFVDQLSPAELARIESSVNYLEIREQASSQVLLRTEKMKISVPTNCLPHYSDNTVPDTPGDIADTDIMACYHEDRFHDDGVQWRSSLDSCTMCNCQRGRVKCETMICPHLTCPNTRVIPGECCLVCTSNEEKANTSLGCIMAGEFHLAGSSWHPYLPPQGFDTCTVCTCNISTLSVSWTKVTCPVLTCHEKDVIRVDKNGCCKQCPEPLPIVEGDGVVNEEAGISGLARPNKEDIILAGGCDAGGIYANGQEWHPRVYPHGLQKCVKCRCKDRVVSCERKLCSRTPCHKDGFSGIRTSDECCPQCRRKNRHHKAIANG